MSRKRFRREKKLYALNFEELDDFGGLEVTMSGVSLERFLSISRLQSQLSTPNGQTTENIEKQFEFIGSLIESWNLEDEDGKPVPPTYESLKQQDFEFAQVIAQGYFQALASVPKASNSNSNSGPLSEEPFIPMEAP